MKVICPKCQTERDLEPTEIVEGIRDVPARNVFQCPDCEIPFYMKREEHADTD